jgi:hypothetical protein
MNFLSMMKPLLLIEIIILLIICLVILLALFIKQRGLLKKVHEKFVTLTELNNAIESMDEYFTRSIQETINRYKKLTNSSTVIFDINRPYSEKVSAIRYLFLNIEKEAEERKKSGKISWNFYDDKFELLIGLLNKQPAPPENQGLKDELTEYKTESKAVITKLKDIISSLQTNMLDTVAAPPSKEYQDMMDSISNENLEKIRNLFDEMKHFSDNYQPQNKNYIEKSINTLEYEVESSDRFITNLKTSSDNNSVFNMKEINKLKESNKIQRGIISNLEQEISMLRDSIDVNSSQEVKDTKTEEINRLERLVQEYEGCVTILEDQINDLYNRLEEQAKEKAAADITAPSQDLHLLNTELQNVSKRMNSIANDYRQAVAMNRSIYNFSQCKTVKEIANHIVKMLKEFNVASGFYIQSTIGKADYFPSLLFNDTLKRLIKNSAQKEHMGQLNGNSLFVAQGIKLITFPSEGEADSINSTISGLVCIAGETILRLENAYALKKNNGNIDGWISLAKNKIANIDIQFSYQAEENKKIYNQFIADLKKSYQHLDLQGEGAVILDTAINEYEARMHLLLSSGDVIEKELEKLTNHLATLKLQNAQRNDS